MGSQIARHHRADRIFHMKNPITEKLVNDFTPEIESAIFETAIEIGNEEIDPEPPDSKEISAADRRKGDSLGEMIF